MPIMISFWAFLEHHPSIKTRLSFLHVLLLFHVIYVFILDNFIRKHWALMIHDPKWMFQMWNISDLGLWFQHSRTFKTFRCKSLEIIWLRLWCVIFLAINETSKRGERSFWKRRGKRHSTRWFILKEQRLFQLHTLQRKWQIEYVS